MAAIVAVQGSTLTTSGITGVSLFGFSIPGWDKNRIERTALGNTAWTTAKVGELKQSDDLIVMIAWDEAITLPEANQTWVITLPASAGAWTIWGQLKNVSRPEIVTSEKQTEQLRITLTVEVTNLNDSDAETPIAFA